MAADGGTEAKAIPEHGWAVIDGGSPAPDDSGSVEFFRDALNALPAAVAIVDQEGRLSAANRLWLAAAGGVLLGRQWGLGENLLRAAELVQSRFAAPAHELVRNLLQVLEGKLPASDLCVPAATATGQDQLRIRPFASGEFVGAQLLLVQAAAGDSSAEHMLTQTRQRYDDLFNTMPVMLHFSDSTGHLTAVNDHWLGKLGYGRDEVLGKPAADFFSPQSRHLLASHYGRQIASEGSLENVPLQMMAKDGALIDVLLGSSVEKDDAENLVAICARMVDITDRNEAEAARRKTEARFERAVRGTSDGLWDWDLESGHVWFAPRFKELLGYEADEFADNFTSFKESLHPDDRGGTLAAISQRLDGESFDIECRLRTKAGSYRWFRVRGLAHRGDDGTPRRMAGSIQDITLQKLTEQALRENRNFFELILDSVPAHIAYVDATFRVQFINRACAALLGLTRKAAVGRRLDELIPASNFAAMEGALSEVLLAGQAEHLDVEWPLSHGSARLEIDFLPHKNADGRVLGFFWLARDVTTHHQLEAELRQAQKMEAVGQLTGGIAHDFNNLLSVILGNLQLLERRVNGNVSLAKKVATAKRAAIRGAELTRRLLAFARQQVLEPEIVILDALVLGMEELLTRTLGQYIDVTIHSDTELWSIEVDPGQVENCLLNLAINARDAMADGGELIIETRNATLDSVALADHPDLQPGEYVMLAVEDTGSGIEPDILAQVVEPFFTTKEVGKGTGLGLSMVFGFVKQSGGHAEISSAPGEGTCVKLYFPRCEAAAIATRPESSLTATTLPTGSETVLLVEDDADVRETALAMLADLGYQVIPASGAAEAVAVLESEQAVDLLFTDVMMPGMRGTQLTDRARELRPTLKVLYTTGFTATGILQQEILTPGADLIGKPYRAEDLALMVRHTLDGDDHV